MSSDDIKESLICWFEGTNIKDWKRISKKKIDDQELRVFENKKIGAVVAALDEDQIQEVGEMYYHIMDCGDDELVVSFAPKRFWEENKCITDQHITWALEMHYGLDTSFMDEACENQLVLIDTSEEEARRILDAAGFVYNADMAMAGQIEVA